MYRIVIIFFPFFFSIRPHSSLAGHTPYEAHFDSNISAQLARLQSIHLDNRQRCAKRFQLQSERLSIGDKVLLRTKKHSFDKLSPVFAPYYEPRIYTIESIDKRFLPWLYILTERAESKRKFYAFELHKLDVSYQSHPNTRHDIEPRIYINDVLIENRSALRSGRVIPGKGTAMYLIERNNEVDKVPESTLRLFKSSLGSDSLIYSTMFQDPAKQEFIV